MAGVLFSPPKLFGGENFLRKTSENFFTSLWSFIARLVDGKRSLLMSAEALIELLLLLFLFWCFLNLLLNVLTDFGIILLLCKQDCYENLYILLILKIK